MGRRGSLVLVGLMVVLGRICPRAYCHWRPEFCHRLLHSGFTYPSLVAIAQFIGP